MIAFIAVFSSCVHAYEARVCTRTSGARVVWETGIGPFLYAALAVLMLMWLIEESKQRPISIAKIIPIILGTLLVTAAILTVLESQAKTFTPGNYKFTLVMVAFPSLLKIATMLRWPRLGRAVPAMTITCIILALVLLHTASTSCNGSPW